MSKLCDTCIYGDKTEYFKPCIIYRDDCELYEEKMGTTLQNPCIMCTDCKNFEASDNYCRMLQINFLPDEFGCNKGEKK